MTTDMKIAPNPADKFLRYKSQLPNPPCGLTKLDMLRHGHAGPQIPLTLYHHSSYRTETGTFSVEPDNLPAPGHPLCGKEGRAWHLLEGREYPFLGFVLQIQEGDRVMAYTKGIIELSIPNATNMGVGKPVYCTGPQQFNLDGGTPIGRLLFVRPEGKSCVLFVKGGQPENADWERAQAMFGIR